MNCCSHERQSRVLIVDDDYGMRRHLRQALEAGGYAVAEAENGAQAMRMAVDSPPDLVLLDIVMGGMDGFATCAGLRHLPAARHLPILMVTALEDPKTIDRAYAMGATDYIPKPINPAHLRHHVRYLLRAHRISEELRQKESRLAQAQRIAKVGDWEWNGGSEEIRLSEEALRMLGLPAGEPAIAFRIFLDRIHTEDRGMVEETMQALAGGGVCCRYEFRLLRAQGVRVIHLQGEPIAGATGLYLAGTLQDVTERKSAEERLLLSAKVFENSSEMILIAGASGEVIDINPSFCGLSGYSREDLVGRSREDLQFLFSDPHFPRQIWNLVEKEGHWQGEVWKRRRSGENFPALVTVDAVRRDSGKGTHFVWTAIDISRLKDAEQRLRHLSHHDLLTGLPNRLLFHDRLRQALAAASRRDGLVAVIVFDVDNFKEINDSIGHPGGDEVLRSLAQRVQSCMRRSDTFSRLGGDEFSIILGELGRSENGALVTERIMELLQVPFVVGGKELFLNVSAGLSLFPEDATEAEALVSQAGAAMRFAKRQGGNRYQFFSASMHLRARERLEMKTSLRRGLERQEFFLHFQPKFDIVTGALTGLEALARWENPALGMVPPLRFIPLAEESGLIVTLGEELLRLACAQNRAWQERGFAPFRMAVNLSPCQLRDFGLVETVRKVLSTTGMSPGCLELEITESAVMQDMDLSIAILRRFREMGIRIALDDFGTGYSSLSHLRRIPVDALKIDHSFVRDLFSSAEDAAIVRAIISMARNLNLTTIAEGVETEEQREFLREQGCDEIQGYLAALPLPKEEIERFLPRTLAGSTAFQDESPAPIFHPISGGKS